MSPQFLPAWVHVPIEALEARRLLSVGDAQHPIPIDVNEAGVHVKEKFDKSLTVRYSFEGRRGAQYIFTKPNYQGWDRMTIFDSDGRSALAVAKETGDDDPHYPLGTDHLRWRAPHAGTFYLELKWTFKWEPSDPYEFYARIVRDDFGDSPATAGKLRLGQSQKAHLESMQDRDWFAFEAEAGKFYRVTEGGDLGWPRLTVFASDGKTAVPAENYDSLVIKAPSSGTYYIKAETPDTDGLVNLYTFKVAKLSDWGTSPENAPAWDLSTTLEGELAQGTVNYYRFEAEAGDKYVFVATGTQGLSILDSDGKSELGRVFVYMGGSPGRLEWTAPHSGSYYVSASAFYCCLFASVSGPYSLDAYKVTHDADPAKAPLIEDGQTVKGNMENPADAVYFSFEAKAGSVYEFTTDDKDEGADYLLDVIESTNYAANMPENAMEIYPGHNVGHGFDGETGLMQSMGFYAERSGTYHVRIAPVDLEHSGPYALTMTEIGDDFLNDAEHPAMLALGKQTIGRINYRDDRDYFALNAKAGKTYSVFLAPQRAIGKNEEFNLQFGLLGENSPPPAHWEEWTIQKITFTADATRRYVFSVGSYFISAPYVIKAVEGDGKECDPQMGAAITSPNTPPKSSSHSARHRKPKLHHRRPAAHKHEKPSAKENLHSARRKLLSLARD